MLPFIVAGIAGAAAYAAYKKYKSPKNKSASVPPPVSIGKFAIWGQPNSGKSTFISQLVGKPTPAGQKEATTSKTVHSNIPVVREGNRDYQISEITDMPGHKDRRGDWLKLVKSHDHVFYLLDLSRTASDYIASVRYDLSTTVEALKSSPKTVKRLHIIASHVDQSDWKHVDAAQVNNELQRDDQFSMLYELTDGVAGYVYVANLTDEASFKRLIESIIKDVRTY
jgi:GTPase Era involved in 16S rRNA processing